MSGKFLFVCGCPRSGTTAIAKLLNSHSKVILGMERYKYQIRKNESNAINPSLFCSDNFLNFQTDETNIIPNPQNQWFSFYESIALKFKVNASSLNTVWVGDKLPFAFNFYEKINYALGNGNVKWILMLRDVEAVAVSYNSRSSNANDPWPKQNDYKKAVLDWNDSLISTHKYFKNNLSSIFICEYEELFSYNLKYFGNLINFLELEVEPDLLDRYQNMTNGWESRYAKSKVLDKHSKSYLQENAKYRLCQSLIKRSRVQHTR